MVYQSEISCGHREMHDLTGEVARIVKDSGIRDGVANIFNVGSTGQLARSNSSRPWSGNLPEMLNKPFPQPRLWPRKSMA